MSKIRISDSKALADAIAAGFVVDDGGSFNDLSDSLDSYDHNGNPFDHAAIYRLWLPDGTRGTVVQIYDDREESCVVDANGCPE